MTSSMGAQGGRIIQGDVRRELRPNRFLCSLTARLVLLNPSRERFEFQEEVLQIVQTFKRGPTAHLWNLDIKRLRTTSNP